MKLFLDSIDIKEIEKYSSCGIIDGVTTNPTLMSAANKPFQEVVKDLCAAVQGDVSIEVASNDFENMVKEGEKIAKIAKNIVIKLPVTWDGLRACKYFSSQGRKVNMTLCFSANQALLAAKAGAFYISPFIGRLDDEGEDGMQLISEIRAIYDNYNFDTQILAASVRSVDHVVEAAICGADVATIPLKLVDELVRHPLTDKGLKRFNEDWAKSGMVI